MQTFERYRPRPASNVTGVVTVVTLHAVLGWALLQALGHRRIDLDIPPLRVEVLELPPPPPAAPPPTPTPSPTG